MKTPQRGFNLIEAMLALTVAGVLLSVGIPALRDMTVRQQMTTSAQELRTDLTLARQEAVTRGQPASVCTSADGVTCAGTTNWAQARIVFSDANGNGLIDGADVIVRQSAALQGGITATSTRSAAVFSALGTHNAGPFAISVCKPGLEGIDLRIRRTGHAGADHTGSTCP
jgi:type IV fimbrial biogenesis protein FimT